MHYSIIHNIIEFCCVDLYLLISFFVIHVKYRIQTLEGNKAPEPKLLKLKSSFKHYK